jgi:hypothetical protein
MLTFAAPMAWAQADRLSAVLVKDVACSAPDAMAGLQRNLSTADASPIDTRAALGAIAADTLICTPIREAAEDLVNSSFSAAVGPSAAASNSIIAEALAEAERRAANMKFEVGPPPPRLTRGRNPGP